MNYMSTYTEYAIGIKQQIYKFNIKSYIIAVYTDKMNTKHTQCYLKK